MRRVCPSPAAHQEHYRTPQYSCERRIHMLKSILTHAYTQGGAESVWGHEKAVYMNAPGRMFRHWTLKLGLAYRIRAAFRVRPECDYCISLTHCSS